MDEVVTELEARFATKDQLKTGLSTHVLDLVLLNLCPLSVPLQILVEK